MHKKGFTLIELLVVVSIIGLLSSIVIASLREARTKAEVSKVKESFLSVRNALELYRANNDGDYPGTMYGEDSNNIDDLISSSLSSFMTSVPTVPNFMQDPSHLNEIFYQAGSGSCGDESGTEGYTITFYPSEDYESEFPIFYIVEPGPIWVPTEQNCLFIAPK